MRRLALLALAAGAAIVALSTSALQPYKAPVDYHDPTAVSNEPITVTTEDGVPVAYLAEAPLDPAQGGTISVTLGGAGFTRVTGTPAAGQYRIRTQVLPGGALEYMPVLVLNAADLGKTGTASYWGTGSIVHRGTFRSLIGNAWDLMGVAVQTADCTTSPPADQITYDQWKSGVSGHWACWQIPSSSGSSTSTVTVAYGAGYAGVISVQANDAVTLLQAAGTGVAGAITATASSAGGSNATILVSYAAGAAGIVTAVVSASRAMPAATGTGAAGVLSTSLGLARTLVGATGAGAAGTITATANSSGTALAIRSGFPVVVSQDTRSVPYTITTASFNANAGDTLVAFGTAYTLPVLTGSSLRWVPRALARAQNDQARQVAVYTAVVPAGGVTGETISLTVPTVQEWDTSPITSTTASASQIQVFAFDNSAGVGSVKWRGDVVAGDTPALTMKANATGSMFLVGGGIWDIAWTPDANTTLVGSAFNGHLGVMRRTAAAPGNVTIGATGTAAYWALAGIEVLPSTATAPTKKLLVLGDSGVESNNSTTPWPPLVQESLGADWALYDGGVWWAVSPHVRTRWASTWSKETWDMVVLHVGSNDVTNHGVLYTTDWAAVASSIATAVGQNRYIVQTIQATQWYGMSGAGAYDTADAAQRSNAPSGAHFFDWAAALGTSGPTVMSTYMSSDGQHWNDSGNAHIADEFVTEINSLMALPANPVQPAWGAAGAVANVDGSGSISLASPTGVTAGDILIAAIGGGYTSLPPSTITDGNGKAWARKGAISGDAGAGMVVYSRRADGGEASSTTFTGLSTAGLEGVAFRVSGVTATGDGFDPGFNSTGAAPGLGSFSDKLDFSASAAGAVAADKDLIVVACAVRATDSGATGSITSVTPPTGPATTLGASGWTGSAVSGFGMIGIGVWYGTKSGSGNSLNAPFSWVGQGDGPGTTCVQMALKQ
jgi:hypothetical protein